MSINLKKGGKINLTKKAPSLKKIHVGLGWDERISSGADFDLDAVVFMLDARGRIAREEDFIFYNNLTSPCGAVQHQGDNRTGAGEGDDEVVHVFLEKIPERIHSLVFAVTIHEAEERNQTFGMIRDAFMRLVDLDTEREVARYDLSRDYSTETSMIFGELQRVRSNWIFKAIGQGYEGGLVYLLQKYGINL